MNDEHAYNCSCTECITDPRDDPAFGIPPRLVHHLQHNHFPAVDLSFAQAALEAISLCETEDYDLPITMPNGITLTAAEIVEGLHLEGMVEPFEQCDECEAPLRPSMTMQSIGHAEFCSLHPRNEVTK